MNLRIVRAGALLAINLLFLSVWGFAGTGKVANGMPSWFPGKFGKTFLGTFPGLTVTFWVLAMSEVLALALGLAALARMEFLARKPTTFLQAMLVWSLFVFVQLGFGQWLTNEFNGAFQHFMYFSGTLLALQFVTQGHNQPFAGRLPDGRTA
jgi:hypothetical protein